MKSVSISFKPNVNEQVYPIFFDTELEKVSDVKLFYKKGKKLKEIEIDRIYEEDIDLDELVVDESTAINKKVNNLIKESEEWKELY